MRAMGAGREDRRRRNVVKKILSRGPVTDINAFVRPSQRKAQREAGLARLRQQVKAGQLEIHWMSEEEKAAYRLLQQARGEQRNEKCR